ncbi:MAG: cation transporter, partial [Candidatus Thorarchaeota archaeon]
MSMKIEGMHCASCVATIEKSLLNEDGVISASVSLLDEKAVVEYDSSRVDRSKLERAVDTSGYRVKRSAMTMIIASAESENDWMKIKEALNQQNGVITVNTFPDKRKLLIEYDEEI